MELYSKSMSFVPNSLKNFEKIRESLDNIGYDYKEIIREREGKTHRRFSIHNKEFRDALENWLILNFGK